MYKQKLHTGILRFFFVTSETVRQFILVRNHLDVYNMCYTCCYRVIVIIIYYIGNLISRAHGELETLAWEDWGLENPSSSIWYTHHWDVFDISSLNLLEISFFHIDFSYVGSSTTSDFPRYQKLQPLRWQRISLQVYRDLLGTVKYMMIVLLAIFSVEMHSLESPSQGRFVVSGYPFFHAVCS